MTDLIKQVKRRIRRAWRYPLPRWVKVEVLVSIATFILLAFWCYADLTRGSH